MQTVYRDPHDEQSIALELRGSDLTKDDKMPTKELVQRIVEGRARALALVKLCCGPHSMALVKSYLDLANAYALQGLWQQAEDRVLTALETLIEVEGYVNTNNTYVSTRRLGMEAANRIVLIFTCLRKHVVRNCGQVKQTFLKDLLHEMSEIVTTNDPETAALQHPSKLFSSLAEFLTSSTSKHPLKQLTKSYFADQNSVPRQHGQHRPEQIKTWGDVVDFLRNKCEVFRSWADCALSLLLPQTKAQLTLPFKLCDPGGRLLAHPVQLANSLPVFPSVAKLITGTQVAKVLAQYRTEVPIAVNAHTGSVQAMPRIDPYAQSGVQGVVYELPITFEDYICTFLLQSASLSLEQQFALLKAQALTLKGVCSLHLSALAQAEEVLLKALQELESVGLEEEPAACELYNSIAQMMITKYQQHMHGRKDRWKADAEHWVQDTEEGKRAVRIALRAVKKQFSYQSQPVSTAQHEFAAREQAIAQRIKTLMEQEEANEASDPMRQTLEAAYRYLVKSYEIAETTHGALHPIVGTACLAVASVQNLLKDFESTREWLLRAIRIFEKAQPTPHRAITFAQTQLSHALTKMGHDDEARRVLNKAAQFHLATARAMLTLHLSKGKRNGMNGNTVEEDVENDDNKPETARSTNSAGKRSARDIPILSMAPKAQVKAIADQVWPTILKDSPLHDEIHTSVTLLHQVIKMDIRVGERWEASLLAEEVAHLLEDAYGWDSIEAADAKKQVGIRCLEIEDWPRAVRFLSASAEAHLALYGKTDGKYLSVTKLLARAKKSRAEGAQGLLEEDEQRVMELQVQSRPEEAKVVSPSSKHGDSSDASIDGDSPSQDTLTASSRSPTTAPSQTNGTNKSLGHEEDGDHYDQEDFLVASPER